MCKPTRLYPTTVATLSKACKKVTAKAMQASSDKPEDLDFKLHDFGFRGATSPESAARGACAHLVNFKGTDTVVGVLAARFYYGADMAGYSIPAAEHSTITSYLWGGALRQKVIDHGGLLVIRPDSGEPVDMVCRTVETLAERFGFDINSKGFSADNVNFGMGGGLLQDVNRDTCRFAMKCSAILVNGQWRNGQLMKDHVFEVVRAFASK